MASIAFVATNVLHTADHVRQGLGGLSWELFAGGSALSLAALATLVLTLLRDPRAPLLAATVGLLGAAGIAASHLAPYWSALSDPYPAIHADVVSCPVLLAGLGAALLVAVAGIGALSRRGAARRA